MTDPRHRALLDIVKKLPSDFAPWGERSREEDWGPDCSGGCRWYVRLEPGLQLDRPPSLLPSGYAALLCLYGLR